MSPRIRKLNNILYDREVFHIFSEKILIGITYISKTHYHTLLRAATVATTSQVRVSAMLLFMIVGNKITVLGDL
jgi:hypothetical protein